jgi:hypothetical protein
MSDDNRKPILIAIVCACVAVLLLAGGIGAGFGARSDTADRSWQKNLAGIGAGARLTPRDLLLTSGSCTVAESVITVRGTCQFSIDAFGGAFGLGPPTKKAELTPVGGPVSVSTEIEGATVAREVPAGEKVEVVLGRGGGTLALTCGFLSPCQLGLG